MEDNRYIAYCGLDCSHCYSRTHVAPTAEALRAQMRDQGFESFGPYMDDYHAFWRFLNTLIEAEGCPGCRQEGGNPGCVIRPCAREKGLEACALCGEYPCERLAWVKGSVNYPTLEGDNALMREMGLDAWKAMQAARRAEGFTYVQARKEREK